VTLKSAKRLVKFVKIRNASAFHINLLFTINALECDFDVDGLGDPIEI